MKRITSIFLIVTVIMSVFVVSSISTSAASNPETVSVTKTSMGKNGDVYVQWRTLPYCRYYRVFYKIDNAGWTKAADVYYTSQGNYYPGQTMSKQITVPLNKIHFGDANDTVRIYVTVRGMDANKTYNTSYRSYLVSSDTLKIFAPRMCLANIDNGKATFGIIEPQNVSNTAKFRVFFKRGANWKAIGDFNKSFLGNRAAFVTLNVPLYRVDGKAQFTVRGVDNNGQFTTPYLNDAVVENYPDYSTYRLYKFFAG